MPGRGSSRCPASFSNRSNRYRKRKRVPGRVREARAQQYENVRGKGSERWSSPNSSRARDRATARGIPNRGPKRLARFPPLPQAAHLARLENGGWLQIHSERPRRKYSLASYLRVAIGLPCRLVNRMKKF